MSGLTAMPDSSRVWVYQAIRKLTPHELDTASGELDRFITNWAAHGQPLFAGYEWVDDLFLVLAVDDTKVPPSGCSIDASVHEIQRISQDLGVDLFDRRTIAVAEGTSWLLLGWDDFQNGLQRGDYSGDTIVANNLVQNLGQWRSSWRSPASASWHAQAFELS